MTSATTTTTTIARMTKSGTPRKLSVAASE